MTATLESPGQAASKTLVARDYWRNSSGQTVSLERQQSDNGRMIVDNGWLRHPEPYSDLVSASKFSRKRRGGYKQLVTDLKSGAFEADLLVVHEASRGSRRLSEWCLLIELCEAAGVQIAVATHGKVYDPSNARDVRTLQEDGVDAQYESGKLSSRILSGKSLAAERGLPNNGKRYGYEAVHAVVDGKPRLVNLKPVPAEAQVVQEVFKRFTAGESLRAIERDFYERGIRSRSGNRLSRPVLYSWLRSEAYIAKRTYEGKTYSGVWPALITPSVFYQAQRILDENAEATSSPEKTQRRHGRATHLLSGIAKCDVCGDGLSVLANKGRNPVYRCKSRGCTRIDYHELNGKITLLLIAYLSDGAHIDKLVKGEDRSREVQAVKDQLATIRMDIRQLEADVEAGEVSARMATAEEKRLTAQEVKAQERLEELTTPSIVAGLLPPGKRLEERWEAATSQQKRQVAAYLLTPALIGELRVKPAQRRGRIPSPVEDRIRFAR
ncbi:DNA invertase Pin-like site-specific DNA recombinase [Prauserella shujinwangii]|uniref:DNA invertase Pin-like site-specific DNA recombinase n=1 Tax=Prauserella shujinwangii TaxID=1453103 RepID=A0A2T0LSZ5_9PSEU|nr:recombinase family protein [Prauserella shujinwangii]PRX46752.1 DNA invertase Pin-like site-specific DNA recombinase [Prauserella shujinwangii]